MEYLLLTAETAGRPNEDNADGDEYAWAVLDILYYMCAYVDPKEMANSNAPTD